MNMSTVASPILCGLAVGLFVAVPAGLLVGAAGFRLSTGMHYPPLTFFVLLVLWTCVGLFCLKALKTKLRVASEPKKEA